MEETLMVNRDAAFYSRSLQKWPEEPPFPILIENREKTSHFKTNTAKNRENILHFKTNFCLKIGSAQLNNDQFLCLKHVDMHGSLPKTKHKIGFVAVFFWLRIFFRV